MGWNRESVIMAAAVLETLDETTSEGDAPIGETMLYLPLMGNGCSLDAFNHVIVLLRSEGLIGSANHGVTITPAGRAAAKQLAKLH